MKKAPVLVVMAAGMGSRYGGLKQIDPVGNCGEAILDFSLFDAYEAGFRTAVIIIKEAIREDFMSTVGERLKKCPMEIRYAYQELDKLPEGYEVPEGRTKPWGTSHAVLCAKNEVDGAPFAVINADDYYGKEGYKVIYDFLANNADDDKYRYCMVGYELGKTVTDNGSVARGVCQTDENSNLTAIVDHNHLQSLDTCENTMLVGTLAEKWAAFGWDVAVISGHDHDALRSALARPRSHRPLVIIAHTVKGKGVPFMENQVLWHYRFPHDGWEYDQAVTELHKCKPEGVEDPYTPNGIENPALPDENVDIYSDHTVGETFRPTWFRLQEVAK